MRIQIDQDENTKAGIVEYLDDVMREIKKGMESGEGWDLEGEEEEDESSLPDEPELND